MSVTAKPHSSLAKRLIIGKPMTEEQARSIYQILTEECGAIRDASHGEQSFVVTMTRDQEIREYRFQGKLGFGGKLRVRRSSIYWENNLCVDCYPEDITEERTAMIDRANTRLKRLLEAGEKEQDGVIEAT